MTRTYITKSTETLSSLPQTQQTGPLSRSSPIDFHYYQPKDQRFVDYNVKYLRNIEEEERRIKENQERRELEEEERRRRIEEEKYLWEMKQKEFLEKVRAERDKKVNFYNCVIKNIGGQTCTYVSSTQGACFRVFFSSIHRNLFSNENWNMI